MVSLVCGMRYIQVTRGKKSLESKDHWVSAKCASDHGHNRTDDNNREQPPGQQDQAAYPIQLPTHGSGWTSLSLKICGKLLTQPAQRDETSGREGHDSSPRWI
jgi:hypothetical protein